METNCMSIEENKVEDAMNALKQAIRDDPSYAYAWHANIAMAMYDAMPTEVFWMPSRERYMEIANDGASRFMGLCFDVHTSQDMLLTENQDDTIDEEDDEGSN